MISKADVPNWAIQKWFANYREMGITPVCNATSANREDLHKQQED